MRTLVTLSVLLALLLTIAVTSAYPAFGAPSPSPINLTHDLALERHPTIGGPYGTSVIVAWEQDVSTVGGVQQEVMARVGSNSTFGPTLNISNNSAHSRAPTIFQKGSVSTVLYEETSTGPTDVMSSDWTGTEWSSPECIAGGDYSLSFTPIGVQASDGSTWIARWVRTTGNFSDIIVQKIGGPAFNVSKDGRAWRNPNLVAGNNGEVYVAWVDHTYQPVGFKPGVRLAKVTASGVVAMRQITSDYFAYWPWLAYRGGKLYAVWLGTTSRLIRERVWDGSAWSRQIVIGTGDKPALAITPRGAIYVAWENNGQILLRRNLAPPAVVSSNVKGAEQVALTTAGTEDAFLAFVAGGDIWYVHVAGQ